MSPHKQKLLNLASSLTLVITFVLFVAAAVLHGLSSELLLEAGVFLVSVKLVLSTQKSEIAVEEMRAQLDLIERKLDARK
ncbi:MAG: hypothetical protein ACXWP1_09915 [Bdellovibrionota bacterium]